MMEACPICFLREAEVTGKIKDALGKICIVCHEEQKPIIDPKHYETVKKRVEEDRKKLNQGVIRSFRLKK